MTGLLVLCFPRVENAGTQGLRHEATGTQLEPEVVMHTGLLRRSVFHPSFLAPWKMVLEHGKMPSGFCDNQAGETMLKSQVPGSASPDACTILPGFQCNFIMNYFSLNQNFIHSVNVTVHG